MYGPTPSTPRVFCAPKRFFRQDLRSRRLERPCAAKLLAHLASTRRPRTMWTDYGTHQIGWLSVRVTSGVERYRSTRVVIALD